MKREVFYPPIGIAHITESLTDLIKYKLNGQSKIIINTSAQPNSSPHLGTITTLMCCFALGKLIEKELSIKTIVQFDELENSPSQKIKYEDGIYYKDQKHTLNEEGKTQEEINMKDFVEILDYISKKSNIEYEIRTYNEFQRNKYVRKAIIDIVNEKEYFSKLLFPSKKSLHIRGLCPTCGLGKKNIDEIKETHTKNLVIIEEKCPLHGEYEVNIEVDNEEYIDINTQLRDLTKGAAMIEEDKINNTLTIMLDGGDWSGIWAQRIHTEGMVKLGYKEFPIRFFSPIILDWSGSKFSKSLYLKSDAYKNINSAFINYDNFIKKYDKKGIDILWKEVENWTLEPKKFFRNYSIEYFEQIMEENYE